ncbi:ionotropic receptor 93a-like [Daphnia pulicaria]|uniref:ionotropic receptor 93a-like n=1 Tax=Daphnia pulicaria TaxID=35523 RepID=UPI001EEACE20|nr:ionotropic receptor 93a-like [Daphnia pulicaria]
MIYVINTLTNQGGREAFSRNSFRILAGVWVLCATVLVNSYTGIVTSSLTTPRLKPSINSFEELADSKEIGIVIRSDTAVGAQILEATSGIYKVLGDQVRLHPDRIFVDPFKLNAKLETGQFAYPFLNTFTVAFVSSHYKKEGTCRFKVSKPLPILTGFYSLLHKKGTWYTKTISRGLMDLWESGLVKFWVNNLPTLPKADACFVDRKRRVSRPVAIKLTDLTSAFLILGIGIGLAILVFMLELIYWKLLAMQKKLAIVEI